MYRPPFDSSDSHGNIRESLEKGKRLLGKADDETRNVRNENEENQKAARQAVLGLVQTRQTVVCSIGKQDSNHPKHGLSKHLIAL